MGKEIQKTREVTQPRSICQRNRKVSETSREREEINMREKRTIDEVRTMVEESTKPELVLSVDGLRPAPEKRPERKGEIKSEPVQVAPEGGFD